MTKRVSDDISEKCVKKQKTEDGLADFLSSVHAFIVKAGIEKMRQQIFENQLKKFGGVLANSLSPDVTHVVVDDKMEAERLCRILKVPSPPENVEIVKSIWLSSCLKEKKLVDTESFKLDCSVYVKKQPAELETDKTTHLKIKPIAKAGETSTSAKDSEKTLPKVGYMFGHKNKPGNVSGEEDDSDYNRSDGEEPEHQDSDPKRETLVAVSPHKKLPVCFSLNYFRLSCEVKYHKI